MKTKPKLTKKHWICFVLGSRNGVPMTRVDILREVHKRTCSKVPFKETSNGDYFRNPCAAIMDRRWSSSSSEDHRMKCSLVYQGLITPVLSPPYKGRKLKYLLTDKGKELVRSTGPFWSWSEAVQECRTNGKVEPMETKEKTSPIHPFDDIIKAWDDACGDIHTEMDDCEKTRKNLEEDFLKCQIEKDLVWNVIHTFGQRDIDDLYTIRETLDQMITIKENLEKTPTHM